MLEQKYLDEIRARCEAATPEPWKWDIRSCNHDVKLVTDHSGQYYVMGVQRWGTQGACVSFQVFDKYEGPVHERRGRGMARADKLSKSIPGKEHHEGWDDYIDHPDAKFIENAAADIPALLDEVERLREELDKYKPHSLAISSLPSCNDCTASKDCPHCPQPGAWVRINCHLWRGQEG